MERDAELMERLQRIRALLVEVREDLKAGEGEILADADADADTDAGAVPDAPDAEAAAPRRRGKPVVKIAAEGEEPPMRDTRWRSVSANPAARRRRSKTRSCSPFTSSRCFRGFPPLRRAEFARYAGGLVS